MARNRTPLSAREIKTKDIEWNFMSFPVGYALAVGLFIGLILSTIPGVFNVLFILAMFVFSFGNAHIIARWFRRRTLDRRRERDEEEEKERRVLAARAAASSSNTESMRRRRRRGGKASGAGEG